MRYLISEPWDYLVLSASNEKQAAYYAKQLKAREWLGLLHPFERWLVVPDTRGNARGSGSSTILCLRAIIDDVRSQGTGSAHALRVVPVPTPLRDCHANDSEPPSADKTDQVIQRGPGDSHASPANHSELSKSNSTGDSAIDSDRDARQSPESILSNLRVLIIHAGGDSRRLPVYAHIGKCFIPIPGESDSALHLTLFDKQIEVLSKLPATAPGHGQIVITSGDVLLRLDPKHIEFADTGITFIAARESAETCSKHGVYVCDENGHLRRFLQKPTIDEMKTAGALDANSHGLLDIGLMSFDDKTATRLLELDALSGNKSKEIDLYREICCALGIETSIDQYVSELSRAATRLDDTTLQRIFTAVSPISTHVHIAEPCEFLHFGTMPQLIESGRRLAGPRPPWISVHSGTPRFFDKDVGAAVEHEHPDDDEGFVTLQKGDAWIERCCFSAHVELGGNNILVDLHVESPLRIPANKGLQTVMVVVPPHGGNCVRLFDFRDDFKRTVADGLTILGVPAEKFLNYANVGVDEVWEPGLSASQQTLWNARIHPIDGENFFAALDWHELLSPEAAGGVIWGKWREAARVTHDEIVCYTTDHGPVTQMPLILVLNPQSGTTARDVAFGLAKCDCHRPYVHHVALSRDRKYPSLNAFERARILHTLSSSEEPAKQLRTSKWLRDECFDENILREIESRWAWCIPIKKSAELRGFAFSRVREEISDAAASCDVVATHSHSQSITVTAPVRFDLAGGWTDTPPYTLERGGCVLNSAIDLEGVAPIETRIARIGEPVIRIRSLDHDRMVEIDSINHVLDYAKHIDAFGLAKAALVHATIFRREGACFSDVIDALGGGIEITTHSRVPSGSGLGASSIVGATLITAINRIMGRELSNRGLFFAVLQLEQMLTTGGGWQDQIGGVIGGMKLIETEPGLVPDPRIRQLPHSLIDPAQNGGATLLYYTGLTRLAKNILQQVVGRYLDRDRAAMAALAELRSLPAILAEAIETNDYELFGRCIGAGWELKKRLDPGSTTSEIEMLFRRAKPHVFGATLLGAGGGGFMLLVCRSRDDAARLRNQLEASPPNPHARFYDYAINTAGMRVDAR